MPHLLSLYLTLAIPGYLLISRDLSCIRYDSPGAKVGATELSATSSVSVSDSGNTRLSVISRDLSCIRYDSPGAKVGATELSATSSVSVSDSGNTRLSVISRDLSCIRYDSPGA